MRSCVSVVAVFGCAVAWAEPSADPTAVHDLAARVIRELGCSPRAPGLGDALGWSHSPYLDLAADWPDPHFHGLLLELSTHSNPAIGAAAGVALTRYSDVQAAEAITRLRQDTRLAGDLTVADFVNRACNARGSATSPVRRGPVPLNECLTEPGLSRLDVAAALELLGRDRDDDVLLGFAFLASRGIVLTPKPLERTWDRLDDERRVQLLQCLRNRPYVTDHRPLAHALFGMYLRRHTTPISDRALTELLDTLLWLGHAEAERLTLRDVFEDPLPDVERLQRLVPALKWGRTGSLGTERLLAWLRSMNGNLQARALYELRKQSSDEVRRAVTDFFWTHMRCGGGDSGLMLELFRNDNAHTDSDRCHYARMLEASLSFHARHLDERMGRERAVALIVALEMLTGEVLGASISKELTKPNMDAFSRAALLTMPRADLERTALEWARWVHEHAQ